MQANGLAPLEPAVRTVDVKRRSAHEMRRAGSEYGPSRAPVPDSLAGFSHGVEEHHVQEVTGVGKVVARINKRLTDGIFVTHRRHGRHFGQQAERRDLISR